MSDNTAILEGYTHEIKLYVTKHKITSYRIFAKPGEMEDKNKDTIRVYDADVCEFILIHKLAYGPWETIANYSK